MTDPTPAAMRLATILHSDHGLALDGSIEECAQSLDDAGVREVWETCEKMIEIAESRENVTVRLVALEALARRALAALTGTKEVSDEH